MEEADSQKVSTVILLSEEGFERVTGLGETQFLRCGGVASADYHCSEKGLKMVDYLFDHFLRSSISLVSIQARDVGWDRGTLHGRVQEYTEEGRSVKDKHIHRIGLSFPLRHSRCGIHSP